MGVVCMSSWILRRIFSAALSSNLETKSAVVLTGPAMCAFFKLKCNTLSHAFPSAGGIALVWRKRATDLLSVRTIVGFVAYRKIRPNYWQKFRLWKSLPRMDTLWVVPARKFLFQTSRGVRFPFWLDFTVWVIFNHEGKTRASEDCFGHQDKLFSWEGLFYASLQASLNILKTESEVLWVLTYCCLVFLLWGVCGMN